MRSLNDSGSYKVEGTQSNQYKSSPLFCYLLVVGSINLISFANILTGKHLLIPCVYLALLSLYDLSFSAKNISTLLVNINLLLYLISEKKERMNKIPLLQKRAKLIKILTLSLLIFVVLYQDTK